MQTFMSLEISKIENSVELNSYEKLLYNITNLGDFNVIGIAILDGDISSINETLVKKALFYMYKRHPLFRASLKEDELNKKVYFKFPTQQEQYTDETKFQCEIIKIDDSSRLTDQLEAFNSILFDYKNKCFLWRVKLIKYNENYNERCALALVLPFFITDGLNINALCLEIVNILNSLIKNTQCDEMLNQLELIDNLHELLEKNNLFNEKIKSALEQRLKSNKNVYFNLPGKFKTLFDNGFKITLLPLDVSLSKNIIENVKNRKMKLTGFFFACAIYALKQLYEENNFYFPRDIACGIPANLRIRLEPNLDFSHTRYCVLLTHIDLLYPRIGTFQDIWKDAEYINEVIAENTRFDNGSLLELSHDNEFIELGNSAFEQLKDSKELSFALNSYRNFDLSLSNLGTYLYDRKKRVDGPLKLSEIYHGDSISTDPNAFCSLMLHMSTWDGRIMIQLSSSRKAIATQYSDRFMYLFCHVLKKSLTDPKIF